MPPAATALDKLSSLKGETFDASYKTTQVSALTRLASLYKAYSMTGDNSALRNMARESWPKSAQSWRRSRRSEAPRLCSRERLARQGVPLRCCPT